ncbi:hypothetical protein ZEAMMB73_Zm00001d028609 [Zea mays]|uniref:Uncharacterized protein n=1 Tax=Zea mays TaxID=4577 RepID=A0A1D6JY25_MAIZE|nr:hypothetical protein ZEAMMB73_Zm00001d028609 [Zea mays]ONL96567.1 hypothetical protein ZEAMMB73_Zm00001d028609 [Zea mays]
MYNSSSMDSCPVLQHGLLLDRQQPRPHPGISKTTQQLDGIYALFAVLRLAVVDTKAGCCDFAGNEVVALTESIGKPLADVLKELGKRVPDSLVKTRVEDDGFTIKYIPRITRTRFSSCDFAFYYIFTCSAALTALEEGSRLPCEDPR